MDIVMSAIGWVDCAENGTKEDYWGDVVSRIRLDEKQFSPDALLGLSDFSHVEVLFLLNRVEAQEVVHGKRHPRGNADWPEAGIFAQRAKARPNRIAATICRLVAVEGRTMMVEGLDALNGSPVIDIKPVFAEFLPESGSVRQPPWSHELMVNYFARRN